MRVFVFRASVYVHVCVSKLSRSLFECVCGGGGGGGGEENMLTLCSHCDKNQVLYWRASSHCSAQLMVSTHLGKPIRAPPPCFSEVFPVSIRIWYRLCEI